jgi:hypothetical protein
MQEPQKRHRPQIKFTLGDSNPELKKLSLHLESLERQLKEAQKKNQDFRIDRAAFLYMEPKQGQSPKKYAQCGACWKFTGQSCLEFSTSDKIEAGGTCGLYSYGTPRADMAGQESGGTTPKDAGYIVREVRCENCVSLNGTTCQRFKDLSESKPEYYKLDASVNPKGCCNANISIYE